ncbi:MAG: N-acetyltransferase [Ketobacter sp.]|nr:MAG: N-acetyltransferase [Ketobacter sp.]
MTKILYLPFDEVDSLELIPVLNEHAVRSHLVAHPPFDETNIVPWIESKLECDRLPGCRVRVIVMDGAPVGWCGIQPDGDEFELAVVIRQQSWGIGPSVFRVLRAWAREFGHEEVVIHLLETRPEYRFLTRMATKVSQSSLLGRAFTSYRIPISSPASGV